jgi:hypothetical protein
VYLARMRGPEQMRIPRSNDRGPGMMDPTTKSMSCFKDPSTGSSNPEQDNHQHHPLHEVSICPEVSSKTNTQGKGE